MGNYEEARQGLGRVCRAVSELGITPEQQAAVLHLIERTASYSQTITSGYQHALVLNDSTTFLRQSTEFVDQIRGFRDLARTLDPSESYKRLTGNGAPLEERAP